MSFPSIRRSISAIPLSSLPVVVLDTETTGLNVNQDRVIEIGAVRLNGAGMEEIDTYSALVNPGVPIPAASTAIHRIVDDDVAAAPPFTEAMAAFVEWSGAPVIVGYSIGFDLTILKTEHERNGLAWRMPRHLDVRHLTHILAPNLPSESLETVAAWLELEVADRHRALGDALLTAQIFLALIPLLRARKITTLGEAERACRSLTARMDEEARAGWDNLASAEDQARASVAEYARIDSYPYRHRVADLMHAPPLIIDDQTRLQDALRKMTEKKVSSLFLAPPKGETFGQYGIVTERDILRAIDEEGAAAFDQPVSRYGQRPLVTIDSGEFVYRALSRMVGRGFRHLGVVAGSGELVGALSARDLLRQRASDAVSLGDCIESAVTRAELGRIWAELVVVARALVHEEVDPRDVAMIISRELRALTRRACELAEVEMFSAGMGPAPVPYAMMVLGSGGRGESLLAMDQDNAIIFEEGETGGENDLWFEELGKRTADILNEAGVVYCKGGVMASNAAWRKDVAGWRRSVESWIARSAPEDMLACDIFFDSLPVYGQSELAEELHREAVQQAMQSRVFLKFLALKTGKLEAPTSWFGRLKLDEGRIDLKMNGIMPLFSAARVVALENGIVVRSTPERLEALRPLERLPDKLIDNLIEAHRILLGLILDQQLRDIDHGVSLSNKVAPGGLTSFEKQEMRWALDQIPSVADLLGTPLVS